MHISRILTQAVKINEIQRDMRKKFKQINLALRIQSKGDVRPSFIQTRDFPEMMTKIMICFRIIGKSSQFSNFYLWFETADEKLLFSWSILNKYVRCMASDDSATHINYIRRNGGPFRSALVQQNGRVSINIRLHCGLQAEPLGRGHTWDAVSIRSWYI